MKDIFVEIEFINGDNKIVKRDDIITEETYLKIIEMYIKYIDATILK